MKKTIALLTLSLIVGVTSSPAQTSTNLFWDVNGTTSGIGGTGNWTTTGTTWTTNSGGTVTTISGGWTNGANWTNGVANNAILQGTVGTLTLSSSTIFANQIQVNTSGFTIQNNGTTTSQNRYFRTKNGIILANGVNLNVSSGISTNGGITGFEGPIVGVNGTSSVSTGSSVTITGATLNADSSVRIALDTSTTDFWVPIIVNTTGNGYANISISSSSVTSSLYGDVTVNSGSRLVLGGNNSATSRRINVRGNLSTVNTDLTIGETGGGGMVVLYGNNSIGGNVVLRAGQLGFGTNTAFGNSTIVISDGTFFGQQGTIGGGTDAERTLANKIILQGNVTLGLGSFGTYLGGNLDLNGTNRTLTLANSTYISGAVTNGGINLVSSSASRTLALNGNNTYAGGTTQNGGTISLGSDTGLGTAGLTVNSNAVANTLTATDGRNIANAITLATGASLNLDSSGTNSAGLPTSWTQSGSISGAGSINKTGSGSLLLNASNSYSAGTTISAGTLQAGNDSSFGSGGVTVNGGTLDLNSRNIGNSVTISSGNVTGGSLDVSKVSASGGTLGIGLSGTGSFTKSSTNSLNLTAASSYSGGTTVSEGTLLVNNTSGSGTGSGAVTVSSNAILGGSGTIAGATTMQSGSLLRPGNSPGVLTFGSDLTLNSGANLVWELWANTEVNSPVTFDQIVVGGNLLFGGSNGITLDFGTTAGGSLVNWTDTFWASERSWIIYDVTGTTTGSENLSLLNTNFNDATGASLATARTGATFTIAQVGSDIVVNYVPEPSSSSLILLGLAGLVGVRAFRRKV